MKKLGIVFALMLLGLTSPKVLAISMDNRMEVRINDRYHYAQPIIFVERGVEFLIFPDGSFDFIDNNYVGYRENRISKRRHAVQVSSAPGRTSMVRYTSRAPRTFIGYNRFGEINQINDIYIDYDRTGRVIRIGSVDIGYQRGNNRLRYVGQLKVNYNHWGEIVHVKGHVNRYNAHLNNNIKHRQEYFECDDYDDDYYYYKKNGKRHKHKKRGKSSRR